jgi:hypothetical protein
MSFKTFTASLGLIMAALACGCASNQEAQPAAPEQSPAASAMPAAASTGAPRSDVLNAYVRSMRDDLSRGKVSLINDVMQLNADEAKVFWPIYQEYESELFELGDQRVAAMRQFANDIRDKRLDDSEATRLADQFFDYETKHLALLKKYHGEIAKQLSPVRAAQFAQIEHRVGTVVDLMIASEIPLLSGAQR